MMIFLWVVLTCCVAEYEYTRAELKRLRGW